MAKKNTELSPRAKQRVRSAGTTMNARERKELAALENLPNSDIDTSGMPEITDWNKA